MEASPENAQSNQYNTIAGYRATLQGVENVNKMKGAPMKLPHLLVFLAVLAFPAFAASLRVIDGDTIELSGETVRILNIDASELHRSGCDAEKRLAVLARKRARDLIGDGSSLPLARGDDNRMKDRHGRTLARWIVNGDALVADGLARPWEGKRRSWCD